MCKFLYNCKDRKNDKEIGRMRLLNKLYEEGNERIDKEFSLERVLYTLKTIKTLLVKNGLLDKKTKLEL